jgi:hypothetical protein
VLPLAIAGIALAAVHRSPLGWCTAMAAAYTVTLLVFFVTGRYRLPLLPPLLLLAAYALDWLAGLAAHKRIVGVTAALGVLFAGATAGGVPPEDLTRLAVVAGVGIVLAATRRGGPR